MIDRFATMAFLGVVTIAACSKGERAPAADTARAGAPSASGAQAPAPGGRTIVIEAVSDEKGNYFSPNKIEAHRGDLLRFTLKVGVHNVHFLPDSNSIKTGLPPASELLQLPGQTVDIPVSFEKGHYYFQCDPHAALGMKGHLEVED
ncbi:MAG TPA: plastocyanin/azurin family copper-binding protein [Gemmatimonadaceae bacterium]|nr:plastocyanin/azurin family copper-binding protein [Gemmatimonadaceae bacterium]